MSAELLKICKSIDQIDDQIKTLFIKRLSLVQEIAIQKQHRNLPVLNSVREQEIIDRVTKDMPNQTAAYIKTLFAGILEISRLSQENFLESVAKS